MDLLQIHTLGGLRIRKGNETVSGFETRKVEALFIYLACNRRMHPREVLADLLWDERSQQRAQANLRVALSNLRKLLREYFLIDRETAALNPEAAVWLDAAEFEKGVSVLRASGGKQSGQQTAQVEQAVALYQGEFLAGFFVREARGFEDWMVRERERLHHLAVDAVHDLVEYELETGDEKQGLAHVTRLLELDPLMEDAHRQKMSLLARSWRRNEALAQYETLKRILREELGIQPSETTESLVRTIRAGHLARTKPATDPQFIRPFENDTILSKPRNNLPAQITPLIGREKEILSLEKQILDPDCRLLTLTGPGGIGKTRLGLHLATRLLPHFKDGVFFIDLQLIERSELVITTIAKTLDLLETPGGSFLDILIEHLHDKQLLLFMDNFENLIEVAPLITDLLRASPELKILATSREVLNISGEHLFTVSPLALPASGILEPLPILTKYASVQLFLQRAKAVSAEFEITNKDAPLVAEMCIRLNGLPLAIELAAAQTRFFALEELNRRIADRFTILIGGPRDVHPHQRTLRATFDWSYNLLTMDEQRLFRRLAVFRGSFSSMAAKIVCDDQLTTPQYSLLDSESATLSNQLNSLVQKSLVMIEKAIPGKQRYRLLETISQYAEMQLAECGEMDKFKGRHATYFTAFAEEADLKLHGPEQITWLLSLEKEIDNLRAALDWTSKNDPLIGIRLASAMWWFWITRGYFSEGREWMERFLNSESGTPTDLLNVKAYVRYVYLMSFLVEDEQLSQMAEEGFRRSRQLEDTESMAFSLLLMAKDPYHAKDDTKSISLLNKSVDLFVKTNNMWGTATAIRWLAEFLLVRLHNNLEAKKLCIDGLALSRQIGDPRGISRDLKLLGDIERSLGHWDLAYDCYQESFSHVSGLGDRSGMAFLLWRMAVVAEFKKEYEQAISLRWESVKIFRDIYQKEYLQQGLAGIAYLKVILGQLDTAVKLCDESLEIAEQIKREELRWYPHFILGEISRFQEDYIKSTHLHCKALKLKRNLSGSHEPVFYSLVVLAILMTLQRKYKQAVKLFSATEMLSKVFPYIEIPYTLADWIDHLNKARAKIDEQTYSMAWKEGLEMADKGWDEVVGFTIQEMSE